MNFKRSPGFIVAVMLLLLQPVMSLYAQVASFVAPDTVCTGEMITLTNTTTGGSTYYWNFCSGNVNQNPTGLNIGNPGNLLDIPTYITLVKQGNDCFSFISCQGVGVVRYYHGGSFKNNPLSWTNLGQFGLINFSEEGIQVKYDNGNWYGFVNSYTTIIRLNFGNSLWNTPTATDIGPFTGLSFPHGLAITQQGTTWVGFATCSTGNKLVRFNFGTSLANIPVMTDFGNLAGFNAPGAICLVQENTLWYAMVMAGGNTLARITFGTSLLNTPTGVNLGNPGGFNSGIGLTLLSECESTTGYYVNYVSPGQLGKLVFPTGITGSVTGTLLGNIGTLDKPHSFSEIFRLNDTLYAYITNRQTGTLTRLTFPPCSNASVPSSTMFNPPAFSYNTPGTYNVRLTVNEGLPNQSTLCKSIVVRDAPCTATAAFTAPDTVCVGAPVTITNQSTNGSTYYWSFCSGNTLSNPTGTNIGNPGNLLNIPGYIDLAKDGATCYSFIPNQGTQSLVRYNHGTSFSNNPVSWTNLGSFGMLSDSVQGIRILKDNGQWIGFINNNNRIIRFNFGTSLANTPTAAVLGPYAMLNSAHCLDIFKIGTTWIGYLTCSWGNKLVRLNFGTSLLNTPTLTDLGAPGAFNLPGAFRIINENGNWYGLVVNTGNNTMTRLSFGSTLLNDPTGVNIGVVCPSINPMGIALIRDCEGTTGFHLNYSTSSTNLIWRLSFPSGITGPITGTSLGNIGAMSRPCQFSPLFRVGDTLFLYNSNRQNFTLTRLRFLPCSNASVPSSTSFNPPVYTYNQPGTYNIQLTVDEGLPTQATLCKSIVVRAAPCTATAAFTAPDTVCVGAPVTITNQSTDGTTYYWNFCSGNSLSNPIGTNIGNPGSLLSVPCYIDLMKDGNTCYSFIPNQGTTSVIRYNHGTSFSNNPVSWTNLGSFGIFTDSISGVKVCKESGQWYVFVTNNRRLVRLNFGTSLGNTPTATLLGTFTMMYYGHCIDIFNENGTWVGFVTCSLGTKLVRLNFGTSLLNIPTLTDLGAPGSLNSPGAFRIINENGSWYGLVNNMGNNTMTRLTFGNSLLNTPTGVNLGVICPSISPGGLALIRDCNGTTGFVLNYSTSSPDLIWRLNFPSGITGPITGTSLGNIGAMSRPSQFSPLFRVGDTLFLYNSNRQNHTLTRLRFMPCSNASVPSSTSFNPPVYSYNQPGTYNIQLIVDEGLPTQSTVCKSIVVMAAPCSATASFTAPDTVCVGEPVTLTNTSSGGNSYYWNFCSGNAGATPTGLNIGNPSSSLNWPVYTSMVKDGDDCYQFITNQGTPTHLTRIYHGTNFRNNPVSVTTMLQTGVLHQYVEALQIRNDNGTWYGLICNNNTILRLNFGASILNTSPVVTDLGPFTGIAVAHGITIVKEGTTWLAFFDSHTTNKLFRLNFGTSLGNTPVFTDLGNLAGFSHPTQIASVKENGICYLLINNYNNNTLSRISFGTSWLNTPTGQNLGNCGGLANPHGICVINDCEISAGYYTTYQQTPQGAIGRLNFAGGVGGTVTAQSLGNLGNLDNPCSFSDIFRQNDSLFTYVLNQAGSTLTRFSFPPCTNASIPSSTLFTPPSFTYSTPGTYTVRLVVNEGQFSEASVCKTIVVVAAPCSATASFTMPDTVCVGTPVAITNTSSGGNSYYWNFCSGNAGANPVATNIGNPGGNLNSPVYLTLVKDGSDCYTFVTNQGSPTHISRIYHGTSFANNPVSTTAILQTGIINMYTEALQIRQENGNWYGFLNNNTTILRLNFGASITNNSPTTTDIGPFSNIAIAHGLILIKEGNTWLGFFDSDTQNKLYRLNFGSSLTNTPVFTDLGNLATFSHPCQIAAVRENGMCYLMVVSMDNATLSRISFGNSYLNTPVGQNLGSCGGLVSPVGLTLLNDCETSTGYYTVYKPASTAGIGRLNFTGGISGTVAAQSLGNLGSLNYPHSFSELVRRNDTLISYVTNRGSSTLTRFSFPPCTNASIQSSTLFSPPSFSYNTPGTYSVRLVVNEGQYSEGSVCNSVVVMTPPVANLGNDRSICQGTTTTLDAGAGFFSYLWSTGATSRMITVGTAGNYWVKVTNYGCEDYDTVAVSLYPFNPVSLGPDVTICQGQTTTFNAGFCNNCTFQWSNLTTGQPNIGSGQTYTTGTPGTYAVTVTSPDGCIGRDTIQLFTNPTPVVTTWPLSQSVCSGTLVSIPLTASIPGANFSWSVTASSPLVTGWSPGAGNYITQTLIHPLPTDQTVTYHITPFVGSCTGLPVDYVVTVKPVAVVNASPPSQSVCNGASVMINLNSSLGSTTFSWSASGSSGAISGFSSGSGSQIMQPLFNAGTTVGTVTYDITSVTNGCAGNPITYVVPVMPQPDVAVNPPAQSICSEMFTSIALTSSSSLTTFSWSAALASGNISGFTDGQGSTISQQLTNNGVLPGTVSYTVTAAINGCSAQPVGCLVTVNPVPLLTNPVTAYETCSGDYTNIGLLSNVAVAGFMWSATSPSPDLTGFGPGNGSTISQQIFNSGFTNPGVTYSVIPAAYGCNGPAGLFTVTVHPIPDLVFTPQQTITCTGAPVNIQLASQAQPSSFAWSATGSSAAVTNYSGGAGSAIQQSPQNSGADPGTVTYTVTASSNGCFSTSIPYVVTINPSPVTIISPYPSAICSGETFSPAFSSQTTGTTFSWTASASSAQVSGYSNGVGNSLNHTLLNQGMTPETVTYVITPTANSCPGATSLVEVQVKPTPDVLFNPASQELCYGSPCIISLSSSFAGATLSWTATGSSPAVTGFSNGNGSSIHEPLFTTGSTSQTVTYSLTSALNGCTSQVSQSQAITWPLPDVSITPAAQSICSGQFTNLALQSQVNGAIFQWTATGSPTVTGFSGSNGNQIHQQLFNANSTQGWVTYTVTPSIASCQGTPSQATVNVYVNPVVTFSRCFDSVTTSDAKPFRLRGGLPPGGEYSGSGVESAAGIFSASVAGPGTIQLLYSFTNSYGCSGSQSSTIRVLSSVPFTCGNSLRDVRDGRQYATYLLSNGKCWMRENLDVGTQMSDLLPQTDNCLTEKYLNPYSFVTSQKSVYQWDELMRYEQVAGSQGICPPGWHVPTASEWEELLDLNAGPSQAAGPMKDIYLSNGFHAITLGFNYLNKLWSFSANPLKASFFWSSTASGTDRAIARGLNTENNSVSLYPSSRGNAFSVRCVKD